MILEREKKLGLDPQVAEVWGSSVIRETLVWVDGVYQRAWMAGSSGDRKKIEEKWQHTLDVVEAAVEIWEEEKENLDCSLEQVIRAALVHDVARAWQMVVVGQYNDGWTGFDHPLEGARMFERFVGEMSDEDFEVFTAVAQHGVRVPGIKSDLVGLLRDADKVANMRKADQRMVFRSQSTMKNVAISEEAKAEFMARSLVTCPTDSCRGEYQLLYLSWVFDLNTEKAKRMVVEEGLVEKLWLVFCRDYELVVKTNGHVGEIEELGSVLWGWVSEVRAVVTIS